MIEGIDAEIARFTADEGVERPSERMGGAYDTRGIYEALQEVESRVPQREGTDVTVRTLVRGDPSSKNGVGLEASRRHLAATRCSGREDR